MIGKIREYLQSICAVTSGKQLDYYNWLLSEGKSYTPQAQFQDRFAPRTFTPKQKMCHDNSMRLAVEFDELTLIEGFYITKDFEDFPFQHSWCIDRNGLTVDITDFIFGLEAVAYYGIALESDLFPEFLADPKAYKGMLLWHFENHILL